MFDTRKQFIIIFSLAIAIRLIYLFITPPKQLPDEVFIFERSWYMAIEHNNHPTHYPNNEYYYPPLYFFISSLVLKTLMLFKPEPLSINGAYMSFYFPLRIFSFFLSISSLFLIWKMLEKMKIKNPLKISAFAFIALLPSFASFSIFPSHSLLVYFFLIVLLFIFSKDNFQLASYKHAALSGFIFAMAILSKFEAVIIIPSLILFTVWAKTKKAFIYLAIFSISSLLFGGWWYILNLIRLGWFYDISLFEASIHNFDKPFTAFGYGPYVLITLIRTFFATFGITNQLYLHQVVYALFTLFLYFAIFGLIKNRVFQFLLKSDKMYPFLFVMFLANLAVFLQINLFLYFQAQGRYFFPSILFIGLTLTSGFSSLFKPKYYIPVLFLLIFGILLNFWGFLCIINSSFSLSFLNINMCENMLLR